MSSELTGHMIVKNEDRFIWYAIQSVLPYVNRLIVFDTGSRDSTVAQIKKIKDPKLEFYLKNITHKEDVSRMRQEQLDMTKQGWIWIIDGDEIYPESLCKEIKTLIHEKGELLEGIVVGRYDLIGDIFHYQHPTVGEYNLFGRKGHMVLRLINKDAVPGLHVEGVYPYEGYYDRDKKEITTHNPKFYLFTEGKLFHAMYLKRSSLGSVLADTFHRNKFKIELGLSFTEKTAIPEIFYTHKPPEVPEAVHKRSYPYLFMAAIVTPFKLLKRRLIH